MSMICPECGKRSPVVGAITIDGLGARRSEDVIARRLGCGHVVGGEEYTRFLALRQEISIQARGEILKIEKRASSKIAALWVSMQEDNEEDE